MDVSKYKPLYLQETGEHISGIEAGLLSLEKTPGDSSVLDNLFRHYHSVKGMSASMGYTPIMRLAHAQEDLLDRLRSGALTVTAGMASCLLRCLDAMKELVERVRADEPLEADSVSLMEEIKGFIEGRPDLNPAPAPSAAAGAPEAPAAPEHKLRLSSTMKVEGSVFDGLLASVGDLFMALSSFRTIAHGTRSVELKNGVHQIGKTINSLHESIISARMLPLEDLAAGLPRLVRDLSGITGKSVELLAEGMEISLDRSILEGLGSPLVHIIRNAVDHGIESPEERTRSGKPLPASIRMKASTRKDRVVIEISDDGRGMDRARLRAKAIASGLSPSRVAAMSDREVLRLVCLPGLSTAEKVTSTSGRGVGMDAVKDAIEGFGGSLEIESRERLGTKITLELPRTSSITKALVVEAGGELFLVPISRIEKVIEVSSGELETGMYPYAGETIPAVSLASSFGIRTEPRPTMTLLVLDAAATLGGPEGRTHAGLVVDDFGDEIDAYVKPLVPPMSRLSGASGITVLGDGRPVFLLDIPQIILKATAGA